MANPDKHTTPETSRGYETRDANVAMLLAATAGLALIVVASFILMRMMFGLLDTRNVAAGRSEWPLLEKNPLPPAPRLRVDVPRQLRELRAEEDRILTTYAWVDEAQGIARIPIDLAMAIMAAENGKVAAEAPSVEAHAEAPLDAGAGQAH